MSMSWVAATQWRAGPDVASVFASDPFRSFYNLNGFDSFALSTDIDWAPDYCIEDLFGIVERAGIPITAFATHDSSLLRSRPSFVEIGLHPDNSRPDPIKGLSTKILDLKAIYPDALGVRAHRNFFGQHIARYAVEAGLIYDASIFQWRVPFCQAHVDQYGLVRMTYNWEDGIQADMGLPWDLSHVPIFGPGLKIFNVHPIFIYLNCPNDDYRRSVVKDYGDLTSAPFSEMSKQIFAGYGARSFLIDLLAMLKSTGAAAYRLSDIAMLGRPK